MERKAGRAYRSVLDLVVATCTAALAGAMSVVPPDPRRVAGVVPNIRTKKRRREEPAEDAVT